MFVADLFEARAPHKTVVIISGGFHPFHPGHMSLYTGALKAFPGADVYLAATNDTSERPFPFDVKKQLATIAGVPADRFVLVKSPYNPREITSQYDPENTTLIFVRSEKDVNEQPKPGGTKKNGEPAYLQPLSKNPAPMSQHGYMAYLPTIQFKAGPAAFTSATQIREAWPRIDANTKAAIVADLYPKIAKNARLISRVVNVLDGVMSHAVSEDKGIDSKIHILKQKARSRYPSANTDDEALAMYVHDREEQDVDRLDRVNDREDAMIDQLSKYNVNINNQLKAMNDRINQIAKSPVAEQASGVIATKKQARDPRYSMSLTRDVRPGQVEKNLRAFNLIGKKR